MWDYQLGGDKLTLRSQDLPIEELNRAVATLLGGDPGDLPEALGPLYRLDDRADLIVMLPIFDERGLFSAEGSVPVEVSSGDTFGGEDSEKTVNNFPTSAPLPSQAALLRGLEDDDVIGELSAVISSCLTRISKVLASAPRTMLSASVLAPGKHGSEFPWRILPPPVGSLRRRASPPPWGALSPLPSPGQRGRGGGSTLKSK
ncbi:hypothetical protein ZWY2020_041921 [Hordeum vulgare]|nr:hypothetical protein ZWY2020_041921 [Hordeum vulgare]